MYTKGAAEIQGITLIVIGIILCVLLVGFFSQSSTNQAKIPCGLSIISPIPSAKIKSGDHIKGYANGCGWTLSGNTVGTATLYSSIGVPAGSSILPIAPNSPAKAPYYFDVPFSFSDNKGTQAGYILFQSSTKAKYSLPVIY